MCLNDSEMVTNFYKIKTLLSRLELPYHRIHACLNGCMLFWKDAGELKKCTVYGAEKVVYKEDYERKEDSEESVNLFSYWPKIIKTICDEKCSRAYGMAS